MGALYAVLYLDAPVVKVKDGAHVKNKSAHIHIGMDMAGLKHALRNWLQATEGAKFWGRVCAELSNRGLRDVLLLCCDGLVGCPKWWLPPGRWRRYSRAWCTSSGRLCASGYQDRKRVAATLKPIYTAVNAEMALEELEAFEASGQGEKYPTAGRVFHDAWERFTPFLAVPAELRRVIYTTNAIESVNYQLRKIIKNRGHFSNDTAVKLLWLAICNIEDKRARESEKERRNRQPGDSKRLMADKLGQGAVTTNWKQALAQLSLAYPERITSHPKDVTRPIRKQLDRPELGGYGVVAINTKLAALVTKMPNQLGETRTWDRGKELTGHAQLTLDTGTKVYFADPHSPWQRTTMKTRTGC